MQGWIKLHRKVMESDTFSKLNSVQQIITIYIVLNANHEDGVWYDKYKDIEVKIKRGQLITSRKKIADEWFKGDKEVTEQKVRTTLKKLEKCGFLTITSTNNYTLLEVLNYSIYQQKESEANQVFNQEETKCQPRENQEKTTNKNDKNDKEKEYSSQIKNLLSGYSSELQSLITDYWNVIKKTRKSGHIQYSVMFKTMEKWNFEEIVIKYALKTHIQNIGHDKDEKYTLGIMRKTSKEEAIDRMDKRKVNNSYEPVKRKYEEQESVLAGIWGEEYE